MKALWQTLQWWILTHIHCSNTIMWCYINVMLHTNISGSVNVFKNIITAMLLWHTASCQCTHFKGIREVASWPFSPVKAFYHICSAHCSICKQHINTWWLFIQPSKVEHPAWAIILAVCVIHVEVFVLKGAIKMYIC